MLWEVEVQPAGHQVDRDGARVLAAAHDLGLDSIRAVHAARSFLVEADIDAETLGQAAAALLVDPVVETHQLRRLDEIDQPQHGDRVDGESTQLNVLFKPGVTDNVADSTRRALVDLGLSVDAVATCRKYRLNADATAEHRQRLAARVLANDAIERVVEGPLEMDSIGLGSPYEFELAHVPIGDMNDAALEELSRTGQLYLDLEEMRTIRDHFSTLDRDPTDIELETLAQTWSEHCSHKTLAGRIAYRDESTERRFENMLRC